MVQGVGLRDQGLGSKGLGCGVWGCVFRGLDFGLLNGFTEGISTVIAHTITASIASTPLERRVYDLRSWVLGCVYGF